MKRPPMTARTTGRLRSTFVGRSPEPAASNRFESLGGEDHVGGLDEGGHLASLGELEVLHRFDGDRGDEPLPRHVELHVGDGLAALDALDGAAELVTRADLHRVVPPVLMRRVAAAFQEAVTTAPVFNLNCSAAARVTSAARGCGPSRPSRTRLPMVVIDRTLTASRFRAHPWGG